MDAGESLWSLRMATAGGERRESAVVTGPALQCFGLEMPWIVMRDGRKIDLGLWRKDHVARCGGTDAERQWLEFGSG
jgi:hypothetical protein